MAILLFRYTDYALDIKGLATPPTKIRILTTKVQQTMSGDLYSHIQRPKQINNVYTYDYRWDIPLRVFTKDKLNEVVNFFDLAISKQIIYTDEDTIEWNINVLTTNIVFNETNNYWDFTLTVEGTQRIQI